MLAIRERLLLFFIVCIGLRLLLAYWALTVSVQMLKWMGIAALGPATGFAIIWLLGLRRTGAETGGNAIWWDSLRPVHSVLYFAFAGMAISGNRNAGYVLLADALLGTSASAYHHWQEGNFTKALKND
jgi:hypothetical protein